MAATIGEAPLMLTAGTARLATIVLLAGLTAT
jgi:hypothetical protein